MRAPGRLADGATGSTVLPESAHGIHRLRRARIDLGDLVSYGYNLVGGLRCAVAT